MQISGMQQETGIWTSNQCGKHLKKTRGRGRSRLGAKEKVRRRKCDVRFSVTRRNLIFQKNCVRSGVEKLLQMGLVPAKVWRGKPWTLRPQKD